MPEPIEFRAAAGGQFEAESHGLVDLAVRRGPWSATLFTDTLDLRWSPGFARGRAEVGFRAGAFAGDMWITPWTDGAPDDARKQWVASVGPDALAQRWLANGWYLEGFGAARFVSYRALEAFEVEDMLQLRGEASIGGWFDQGALSVRMTGGLDELVSETSRTAPHATFSAALAPRGRFRPIGEAHAGVASGQDDRIATRLGGLTPYHVPLAGAAWAEFWVEDYATVRTGLEIAPGDWAFAGLLDAGVWAYPALTSLPAPGARDGAVGLAGRVRWAPPAATCEVAVAGSPTLERQPGISRLSAFFSVSTRWNALRGSGGRP